MSTFNLLIILLFILLFGARLFMYCVNMEMPRISALITLLILLMLLSELILAIFEFPAVVIDGIVYISMGNRAIAIGCGVVIFIVSVFIFIIIYPKIKWKKILSFSLLKYAVIGLLLICTAIYTELFNGSYSFKDLDEYNRFKNEFSQYDNHFWPTKFIRETEDDGREILTKTMVYPWDVSSSDGKQFAYKVVTYYDESNITSHPVLYYYPFTYNTYAGIDPRPLLKEGDTSYERSNNSVSDSDSK
ncbi:MAG: hypothetical protein IJM51_01860 [Clostridia bacterium]|nr:hypothetical protein [Clostridia bacterium]